MTFKYLIYWHTWFYLGKSNCELYFSSLVLKQTFTKKSGVIIYLGRCLFTLQEPGSVKDLHHSISLQFTGFGVILRVLAAPEHSALAQTLNKNALSVSTQQYATLQMTEKFTGDVTLALVLNDISRWEVDVLEAVWSIQEALSQKRLAGGDTAALWMSGNRAAHQPTSIVETNHHLRERWRWGNVWLTVPFMHKWKFKELKQGSQGFLWLFKSTIK